MKIGIILSPYGEKTPSGLSKFILCLSIEIVRQAPEHSFIIFVRKGPVPEEFIHIQNVTIKILPDTVFWKDVAYFKNREIDFWLYNNLGLPLIFRPHNSIAIALDFGIFYDFEKTISIKSL